MSSSATQKKLQADPISKLAKDMVFTELNFEGFDGPLAGIDRLQISFQPNVTGPIFGSVRRLPQLTYYAIVNGSVSLRGSTPEVAFELSIDGHNYQFNGEIDLDGMGIYCGTIRTPGSGNSREETEEGSWSAQAIILLPSEKEKRRPATKRSKPLDKR
jgi:hypothetical protein